MTQSQNPEKKTHDAEVRICREIAAARANLAVNQHALGRLFFELKNLYSQRSTSAAGRLNSGRGVFQAKIKELGFRPNRVREWVNDYEVSEGLRPASESTSAKRKARRSNSAEYQRGYHAAIASTHAGLEDDPVTRFAALLPFHALRAAYRAALQELHPDHGGSEERTKELIRAWEEVERLYNSSVDTNVEEGTRVN